MTTKAQRIIDLAAKHPDWSTKQLGAACNCRPEYVRVALRQRKGGPSKADQTYAAKIIAKYGLVPAQKWRAENRERYLEQQRLYNKRNWAKRRAEASP
jgi:hypothetical protein